MECAHCGTEFTPRRHRPWAQDWCSPACWLRMIGELRELSLTVAQWGAALEMPDVVQARDDLARWFADAALAPPREAEPPPPSPAEDDSELPVYCTY
jgi:hypothetical protein